MTAMTLKKKKNSSTWQSFVLACLKVVDDDIDDGKSSNPKKKKKKKMISAPPSKQTSFHQRVSITDLSSSALSFLSAEDLSCSLAGSNIHIFTLQELKLITQNFSTSNFLGEGGFGPVHKGFIDDKIRPGLKAQPVAVKLLDLDGSQGHREWLTEVIFLGQLTHPNLVKLIGYCCEDEHRLLVYEYMPRGSLENQLFRRYSVSLQWSTRMKIALGAAKGLEFLHEAEQPVIYRDFKASNILLDSDYTAKLSDFGLAKDGPEGDDTHVSTRVMGTHGYAAPEYIMTGHLTAASDVYSFGVVLLELLTGRRSVDKSRPHREQNLADWARPMLKDPRKLSRIMDPRLECQYSEAGAQKAAALAYHCLSHRPKNRPNMSNIVKTLEPLKDFKDIPMGTFVYTVPSPTSAPELESAATVDIQKRNDNDDDDEKDKYKDKEEEKTQRETMKKDNGNNGPYHHKHRLHQDQQHRQHRSRTPKKSQTVFSETHLQQALRNELKSPGHHRLKRS